MALWNKKEQKPAPLPVATPPKQRTSSGSQDSVLGSGLHFEGRIRGSADVRLEGRFVGELDLSAGQVTVAAGSDVQANLAAKSVVVEGKVTGDVRGRETILVRQGATVEGDLSAPRVILEDGCRVTGAIDMADRGSKANTTGPPPSPKVVAGTTGG